MTELIAEGASSRAIGERLFLGLNTVKTDIKLAYPTLGVRSRVQPVGWYSTRTAAGTADPPLGQLNHARDCASDRRGAREYPWSPRPG